MTESLPPREAEILNVLWQLGEATADQVRRALEGNPHDSTVRTLLRVLEQKGRVTHAVRGRRYVYKATLAREAAQKHAVGGLIDRFFGGSTKALLLHLFEDEGLSAREIESLRRSAGGSRRTRRTKRKGRR